MEYQTEKIRYISHEIKNQLSICDLYTEILQRYCDKNDINDETIKKSIESIKRAINMAGNSLLELKSADNQELKEYKISELLDESYNLAKVYCGKDINMSLNVDFNPTVLADKNKLEGVIINLVKNACEAFKESETVTSKKIEIYTKKQDSILEIIVSNNACPITDKENIFKDGFTTKQTGSGLGLYICSKNMEEMHGGLNLIKSDNISTDFCVKLKII